MRWGWDLLLYIDVQSFQLPEPIVLIVIPPCLPVSSPIFKYGTLYKSWVSCCTWHVQAHFALLCFVDNCFFFIDWFFFVVTLCQASVLVSFFQQHLLILEDSCAHHCITNAICLLCVSVSHFGNSCNISSLFIVTLLWYFVINDLWCYYCNCFGVPQTTPI